MKSHSDRKNSSARRSSTSSWTISERSLSISTDPMSPMSLTTSPLGVTPTETGETPILPITYPVITFHDSPNFHPQFISLLQHLSAQLWPLVNCVTGQEHPDFPANMLAYNLLTMEKVDNLARHYHQVWPPEPASFNYPVYIKPWIGTPEEKTLDLSTRVRRLGRFFGLSGCHSPTGEDDEDAMDMDHESNQNGNENGNGESEETNMSAEEAELLRQMELEWHQALQRAYAEESHRWNLK